ncbi:hypothetical protein A3Q56_07744 [Intoshia linei]|uniref:Uncharacterized protein n=1 Tax=Intoshia linei TaxID=1819745 RepID=A0A177ASN9_9BILA|nr:hypothetical protein A3Q56_07744 [Intoshia linei]
MSVSEKAKEASYLVAQLIANYVTSYNRRESYNACLLCYRKNHSMPES